jgi:hypothetical protein
MQSKQHEQILIHEYGRESNRYKECSRYLGA